MTAPDTTGRDLVARRGLRRQIAVLAELILRRVEDAGYTEPSRKD